MIPQIKEIKCKIDKEKLYQQALDKFGLENQTDKLMEECAELIQAILHHKQGRNKLKDVAGEMADVKIMIEQIQEAKMKNGEVQEQEYYKLKRLKKNVNDEA